MVELLASMYRKLLVTSDRVVDDTGFGAELILTTRFVGPEAPSAYCFPASIVYHIHSNWLDGSMVNLTMVPSILIWVERWLVLFTLMNHGTSMTARQGVLVKV